MDDVHQANRLDDSIANVCKTEGFERAGVCIRCLPLLKKRETQIIPSSDYSGRVAGAQGRLVKQY